MRQKRRERQAAEGRQSHVEAVLDRQRHPVAYAPNHAEILARAADAMDAADRPAPPVAAGTLWAFYGR